MSKTRIKLPALFTRALFHARAAVLKVFVGNVPLEAKQKVFSTGSLGWHLSKKIQLPVGDALVWCQVSVQVTVIGSRDLPPSPQEVSNAAA